MRVSGCALHQNKICNCLADERRQCEDHGPRAPRGAPAPGGARTPSLPPRAAGRRGGGGGARSGDARRGPRWPTAVEYARPGTNEGRDRPSAAPHRRSAAIADTIYGSIGGIYILYTLSSYPDFKLSDALPRRKSRETLPRERGDGFSVDLTRRHDVTRRSSITKRANPIRKYAAGCCHRTRSGVRTARGGNPHVITRDRSVARRFADVGRAPTPGRRSGPVRGGCRPERLVRRRARPRRWAGPPLRDLTRAARAAK